MNSLKKEMINYYRIKKLGYDFMGYPVTNYNQLSFHHLIVPRRNCKAQKLGDGYLWWNGAILRQNTSHEYLHTIENIDSDMFLALTSEMIDENIKGYLDIQNLIYIDDILNCFEREHLDDRNKKGKKIIKEEYLYRPYVKKRKR